MYGLQSHQVEGGYTGAAMPKATPTKSIAPVLNKFIMDKFPKDYKVVDLHLAVDAHGAVSVHHPCITASTGFWRVCRARQDARYVFPWQAIRHTHHHPQRSFCARGKRAPS